MEEPSSSRTAGEAVGDAAAALSSRIRVLRDLVEDASANSLMHLPGDWDEAGQRSRQAAERRPGRPGVTWAACVLGRLRCARPPARRAPPPPAVIFFYLRCGAQVTHPTGRALGILNSARGHGLILRGDRDALGSPVSPTGRGDGRAPAIVAAGAGGSRRYGQEPGAHAAGFLLGGRTSPPALPRQVGQELCRRVPFRLPAELQAGTWWALCLVRQDAHARIISRSLARSPSSSLRYADTVLNWSHDKSAAAAAAAEPTSCLPAKAVNFMA